MNSREKLFCFVFFFFTHIHVNIRYIEWESSKVSYVYLFSFHSDILSIWSPILIGLDCASLAFVIRMNNLPYLNIIAIQTLSPKKTTIIAIHMEYIVSKYHFFFVAALTRRHKNKIWLIIICC